MKIFLDTADMNEIRKYHNFIYGVTTTPTIVKRSHNNFTSFIAHFRKEFPNLEVHIEAMGKSEEEIINTINGFVGSGWYDYRKVVFKVPIDINGLSVCQEIKKLDPKIRINLHMAFSVSQVALAASVAPSYIAPLIGRYSDNVAEIVTRGARARGVDFGHDMLKDILSVAKTLNVESEILVSSVRSVYDFEQALVSGADVITVPPFVFDESLKHVYTDMGVAEFEKDL